MKKPHSLKIELYIDEYGKLRVKNLDDYEVIGFKIKCQGKNNYIFPIFKSTARKK